MTRASRAELVAGVRAGHRALLARAITLVESEREDDRVLALDVLADLMPFTGNSIRLGISGAPGVGKSTLIEALGLRLVAEHRVAVLAIDPSSPLSGGSILGDKTRMEKLAREPRAFIRPSPGGRTLGGVAARTREAVLLCEAAGFDVVCIETIGVGQSEVEVAHLCDWFLLLVLAGAGDELQGIKKGIVELADAIAITKADGENVERARQALGEYRAAAQLVRGEALPVFACSAQSGTGLDEIWRRVLAERDEARVAERRRRQAVHWLEREVEAQLRACFFGRADVQQELAGARARVAAGELEPSRAALELVRRVLS